MTPAQLQSTLADAIQEELSLGGDAKSVAAAVISTLADNRQRVVSENIHVGVVTRTWARFNDLRKQLGYSEAEAFAVPVTKLLSLDGDVIPNYSTMIVDAQALPMALSVWRKLYDKVGSDGRVFVAQELGQT